MRENNLCFIDGQNLYIGTKLEEVPWNVNLSKFRKYLFKKYRVKFAYYYLGFKIKEKQSLYKEIELAEFILIFRNHNLFMNGQKKGNVDSDIIFNIMKKIYKKENFNKIILVSGDGDFKILVDFLIEENKFEKILFPNKKYASSLYKKLATKYFDYLINIKNIIKK
ncbi:MAG: NYN domain-containing protein [Patescibacteria group bacterium]|jgi:uncharacterized LabA/DUF88 family protein|nr:NYN domain-containing protein [Patescibacteria group bacterium]